MQLAFYIFISVLFYRSIEVKLLCYIMREMQIITTMKYYFIPTRKVKVKKVIMNVDINVEKLEPSYIASKIVK